MSDVLCYAVDVDSREGQKIAARYGVGGLPALTFLEPDGSVRERLVGFLTPSRFKAELRRVRAGEELIGALMRRVEERPEDVLARLDLAARLRRISDGAGFEREIASARDLIARGKGFDPGRPEDRWTISRRLLACGDSAGAEAEIAAIRALDPEGRSRPMRRLRLEELRAQANEVFARRRVLDLGPIKSFLADEAHDSVAFEGWKLLRGMDLTEAGRLAGQGREAEAAPLRADAFLCAREAWKRCPEEHRTSYARGIAEETWASRTRAPREEKEFAAELARHAAAHSPGSAEHLATLAACLAMIGSRREAVDSIARAIELAPGDEGLKRRREEIEALP